MLSDSYTTKSIDDASKRMRLWVVTFADWPHCALQAAVQAWATRNTPYMPSPGQFHNAGVHVIERLRADLKDMRRILRAMHDEEPAWEKFEPDAEILEKLARLAQAMRNGEDLGRLRREGAI